MIDRTRRKLREARFFCDHLLKEKQSNSFDSERFGFYLSAFLSASRSVQDVLKAEFIQSAENSVQKGKRRPWYKDWFPEVGRQARPRRQKVLGIR